MLRMETSSRESALKEAAAIRIRTRIGKLGGARMDAHRFDDVARALASGVNRRSAVKGLVAAMGIVASGGLRPRRAAAQQNVPIGGRCSAFGADDECSQVDTPSGGVAAICSDNGVARDGSFNCCRNGGGYCTQDFHCCGNAYCINNACGGTAAPAPTSTPTPTGSGLGLGSECTATSQCSQSGGAVVCASNDVDADGAKNCCRNTGGSCTADLQCCAALYCVNGTCGGGTSTTGNLAPGATCTATTECSQTGGSVVCADNGIPSDGALNCCRTAGGSCADAVYSADCCGGLYCRDGVCGSTPTDGEKEPGEICTGTPQCNQIGGETICADNGLATGGALACCRRDGGTCATDSGCCAGLLCVNGTCGTSTTGSTSGSSGGSLGPGAECTASSQCSQSGGEVVCADNGLAADGALNCCRYEGGACTGGGGCCGGLECVSGACSRGGTTPAPDEDDGSTTAGTGSLSPGAACTSDDQCSQEGGAVACRDNGLPGDGERNCCRYTGGACAGDPGCCAGLLCVDGICQG